VALARPWLVLPLGRVGVGRGEGGGDGAQGRQ
jgi:hypothetical protein